MIITIACSDETKKRRRYLESLWLDRVRVSLEAEEEEEVEEEEAF